MTLSHRRRKTKITAARHREAELLRQYLGDVSIAEIEDCRSFVYHIFGCRRANELRCSLKDFKAASWPVIWTSQGLLAFKPRDNSKHYLSKPSSYVDMFEFTPFDQICNPVELASMTQYFWDTKAVSKIKDD